MKKVPILLLIGILLSPVNPAFAHRIRSKIHGPGGTWAWEADIPHSHPRRPV